MFEVDTPLNLLLGALTGIALGFLLQRGGLTRYRVVLRQFLLSGHTALRVLLTAIIVGSVGVCVMHALWDVPLHIEPATIPANVIGGVIVGVGMALLGYSPATVAGAVGGGSRHAIFGVAGMFVGAALYAESHAWVKAAIPSVANLGEATLTDVTGLPVWVFVVLVAVVGVAVGKLLAGTDLPTRE